MIELSSFDYTIIACFFSITLIIGFLVSKKSSSSSSEYFLSGRNMPWWLLGISMVATTFSTDTPNLVTDIVRTSGVSGNWVWWAFLLTGLLTVFVYAKLWRRSNVNTDMEFYELRYSGWGGRFLRGFRAIYLGVIFNVMAMSGVTLAAIKIGEIMLGLSPIDTILYAGTITVVFSTVGGFRGVVYTDFILFFAAMVGSVGAAYYLVNIPEVGGMANLIANTPKDMLYLTPSFDDPDIYIPLLIVPLAVQWWSSWYPGAEPGGGGYIAQRMLAAKDENHAIGATFFFNVMHYALRPWPWIIVALASLIVFPDLASIQEAFPNVSDDKLGHDLAYPAMLTMLPSGLLGLVVASLVAAYMSTISTHLNWGSSYIVNDFYKQQIKKNASEKELVNIGRISTIILFLLSASFALLLTNALQLFDVILMFGAGTGLIFILRWFWWRINAWSEITAMFVSGFVSIILNFTTLGPLLFSETGILPSYYKFPMVVLFTTVIWVLVTLFTNPDSSETLINFCKKTNPGGPGWKKIKNEALKKNIVFNDESEKGWSVPLGIICMMLGCFAVYSILFSTGYFIYGEINNGITFLVIGLSFAIFLKHNWNKLKKLK
ncbi:Na+:solute symporter [Flavobacteriaceae bacterium]|jgi:Na+/proline symporter|nr:Na+:solute symporter [Flavobacteriaceae bacterium]|tara:strand:- start:134 stop:1942 length:1809 start_codon:yes stop_codon:yes gene_type:complete